MGGHYQSLLLLSLVYPAKVLPLSPTWPGVSWVVETGGHWHWTLSSDCLDLGLWDFHSPNLTDFITDVSSSLTCDIH